MAHEQHEIAANEDGVARAYKPTHRPMMMALCFENNFNVHSLPAE